MARVLTFSQSYPSYHKKSGEPTYFVEKFLNWYMENEKEIDVYNEELFKSLFTHINEKKNHTIRAGFNWKKGEMFSPRVWAGRPYFTKQIRIAPDTLIQEVYTIQIFVSGRILINGEYFGEFYSANAIKLASNDGLEVADLKDWFMNHPDFKKNGDFAGQIIVWDKKVKY